MGGLGHARKAGKLSNALEFCLERIKQRERVQVGPAAHSHSALLAAACVA